jgi:hypothetical protein
MEVFLGWAGGATTDVRRRHWLFRSPTLGGEGESGMPAATLKTPTIYCPRCRTALPVSTETRLVDCAKCMLSLPVPPKPPTRQALIETIITPAVQFEFFGYVRAHFLGARCPAVIGVCVGLLAIPVGSFLKPAIKLHAIYDILTVIAALGLIAWMTYLGRRFQEFFIHRQRLAGDYSRDWLAVIAWLCLTLLIPLIPWAAAESFVPNCGLIGKVAKEIRDEQRRLLQVTVESGDPDEDRAPASVNKPLESDVNQDLLENTAPAEQPPPEAGHDSPAAPTAPAGNSATTPTDSSAVVPAEGEPKQEKHSQM